MKKKVGMGRLKLYVRIFDNKKIGLYEDGNLVKTVLAEDIPKEAAGYFKYNCWELKMLNEHVCKITYANYLAWLSMQVNVNTPESVVAFRCPIELEYLLLFFTLIAILLYSYFIEIYGILNLILATSVSVFLVCRYIQLLVMKKQNKVLFVYRFW